MATDPESAVSLSQATHYGASQQNTPPHPILVSSGEAIDWHKINAAGNGDILIDGVNGLGSIVSRTAGSGWDSGASGAQVFALNDMKLVTGIKYRLVPPHR